VGVGGGGTGGAGNGRNLGGDEYFIILIVVMVLQVYTMSKTFQVACFKYGPFIVYQLYFNKVIKK
jgi:hypothetical protein